MPSSEGRDGWQQDGARARAHLLVGFVGKEEVVAGEGEGREVAQPLPPDRHGGRKAGVEGRGDPCCAAGAGHVSFSPMSTPVPAPRAVALGADPSAHCKVSKRTDGPVIVPRVESGEGLGGLEAEEDVAMADGVEEGEGREDDLPGREAAADGGVHSAEEGEVGRMGGAADDARDPEEEHEPHLRCVDPPARRGSERSAQRSEMGSETREGEGEGRTWDRRHEGEGRPASWSSISLRASNSPALHGSGRGSEGEGEAALGSSCVRRQARASRSPPPCPPLALF